MTIIMMNVELMSLLVELTETMSSYEGPFDISSKMIDDDLYHWDDQPSALFLIKHLNASLNQFPSHSI